MRQKPKIPASILKSLPNRADREFVDAYDDDYPTYGRNGGRGEPPTSEEVLASASVSTVLAVSMLHAMLPPKVLARIQAPPSLALVVTVLGPDWIAPIALALTSLRAWTEVIKRSGTSKVNDKTSVGSDSVASALGAGRSDGPSGTAVRAARAKPNDMTTSLRPLDGTGARRFEQAPAGRDNPIRQLSNAWIGLDGSRFTDPHQHRKEGMAGPALGLRDWPSRPECDNPFGRLTIKKKGLLIPRFTAPYHHRKGNGLLGSGRLGSGHLGPVQRQRTPQRDNPRRGKNAV